MNDDITRISLDTALDSDRSDWARVHALDDAAIDAAIGDDEDAFPLDLPPKGLPGKFWYQVIRRKDGSYAWNLQAANGETIAQSVRQYGSFEAAAAGVAGLRAAFRDGQVGPA